MPTYGGIQKEGPLKGLVYSDCFPKFGYELNIDNIDFVITGKETRADLFSDRAQARYSGKPLYYIEITDFRAGFCAPLTKFFAPLIKSYEWLGGFYAWLIKSYE
jgi:hypothetical protein